MAIDLATKWLQEAGNRLRVFEGWCLDLADEVGKWLWRQGIESLLVYIEPTVGGGIPVVAHYSSGSRRWKFHAVLFADGLIHDAWLGEALDPKRYFATVFPGQELRVEYRGDDPRRDFERAETWRNGKLVSVERQ